MLMDNKPEMATQVPEWSRPAKRWRIAFKVWGTTTIVVAVLGTAGILLMELAVNRIWHWHLHLWPWRTAVGVLGVCGLCNVPLFVNVLRQYPSAYRRR